MAHLGKRYIAVNGLGEPVNVGEGEEFTVTAKLAGELTTTMGVVPVVDFDTLLAIGAIVPAPTRSAPPKGETPASAGSGG
jgi:hypothetical protein